MSVINLQHKQPDGHAETRRNLRDVNKKLETATGADRTYLLLYKSKLLARLEGRVW